MKKMNIDEILSIGYKNTKNNNYYHRKKGFVLLITGDYKLYANCERYKKTQKFKKKQTTHKADIDKYLVDFI